MGLSLSILRSAWEEIVSHKFFSMVYSFRFNSENGGEAMTLRTNSFKRSTSQKKIVNHQPAETKSLKNHKPEKMTLERNLSFRDFLIQAQENSAANSPKARTNGLIHKPIPAISLPEPAILSSPRPVSELDAAATTVQKVYKSYRTRRNLADCAVVVEELWWKALDFATLKRSSVSFFDVEKPQTALSRWARARTKAAKVGKGLSKDEKAQKLALQHWLEAIDPRHRYGHNLHFYYDVWYNSQSHQPFFYWLDVGDGKEINLSRCLRTKLHKQCIQYLGPKERETYQVIVEDGKLMYRQSGMLVETTEGSKWIFVLSTSRALYVGQKKKGEFQHSSFLAGGATTAAGRLVAHDGVLEAIWPYSGHYHPTEANFREFISFLQEHNVDLTNVKRCSIDDDDPSSSSCNITEEEVSTEQEKPSAADEADRTVKTPTATDQEAKAHAEQPVFTLAKRLSCKWTTGTGPRIGCVRDYPAELQSRALEQVNLSPRHGPVCNYGPIPSPRPSPKVRVSPRLSYMGLPSPRTIMTN